MYRSSPNPGHWNNIADNSTSGSIYSVQYSGIICEWEVPEALPSFAYAIYSGNAYQPLSLYGWKSNFVGDVYTGNTFNYGGSELYVDGSVNAVGQINAYGWKTEISKQNTGVSKVDMPDYGDIIEKNAEPITDYSSSANFIQDKNIIDGGIRVAGSVNISGTTFEGDCYIIADGDITYNVQNLETKGRVFLYSKNGNITINGSEIGIDGMLYAPHGKVTFNTYITNLNGCVWADTISFNGSIFNVTADNFDMVKAESVDETDRTAPEITLTPDKEAYFAGDSITVTISATDNIGVANTVLTLDGTEITVAEDGTYTVSATEANTYVFEATATDAAGNSVVATLTIPVNPFGSGGDEDPPTPDNPDTSETITADTLSPSEMQVITKPTPILGTADGEDFTKYKVEYAKAADNIWHTINESTVPVSAGELGVFDPTLLENGLYIIRVTSYTESSNITNDTYVTVEGNMKVGNFSIAFEDMDVSTSGLPLTVIRGYDSRTRDKSGDFGYGWDLSTAGATLTESNNIGCSGIKPLKCVVLSEVSYAVFDGIKIKPCVF
jgi:hypothetical protein